MVRSAVHNCTTVFDFAARVCVFHRGLHIRFAMHANACNDYGGSALYQADGIYAFVYYAAQLLLRCYH